ncbi:heavy-metal-associated domain-containing protein [Flavobacteriaceae bacterium S0825]|uniref:heavy-metal-associated domain-containing protein n=1 Tax=Gaetbulibacter sp. S0825 TaxID=2720084 RepID=UPI001430C34D|nr:heavy metal-associated domain-containing protein [Gaetbulibacter sp. S0825]MCK0108878.1 heavy-metal-associated domain-containing protein [Flavobacteriaceae bacterium S0825]NIX64514.1 heavy-metal-associated domain-containing protein [Gaetbulibacter sp. S0825]
MKTTLEIQNLKCGGCANTIITRLSALENIENVLVNNDNDMVTFNYKEDDNLSEAINLLSKLGYPIVGESNPLTKKAKSFVSCAVGRMNN